MCLSTSNVVHYAALFDVLKLHEPVNLVGHSLGGWIASLFAIFQGHRVHRLALACPAGLLVPEHPGADLFMISPEKLPSTLAASPTVLAKMTQGEVVRDRRVRPLEPRGPIRQTLPPNGASGRLPSRSASVLGW
jgi:pimeloyl-ACP methyl ester carboxylesterase